jgi:hypothetical protein
LSLITFTASATTVPVVAGARETEPVVASVKVTDPN